MSGENRKRRAAHAASRRLTPVEFEIMEIIWNQGSALVRDVHRELYRRKGLAYTTVMTEMTQMYKKGILAYGKQGRAYIYTPRLTRREALEGTLEDFVADFFHGSLQELTRFVSKDDSLPRQRPPRKAKTEVISQPGASGPAVEQDDVTLL